MPPTAFALVRGPKFDAERLQTTLDNLNIVWRKSAPTIADGYEVAAGRNIQYAFNWVLEHFQPVRLIHLARLLPGGFILPHTDAGPFYERWHIPIYASGEWHDGYVPTVGEPFRVEQFKPHAVWNLNGESRVHLIIDRTILIDSKCSPEIHHPELIPEKYLPYVQMFLANHS